MVKNIQKIKEKLKPTLHPKTEKFQQKLLETTKKPNIEEIEKNTVLDLINGKLDISQIDNYSIKKITKIISRKFNIGVLDAIGMVYKGLYIKPEKRTEIEKIAVKRNKIPPKDIERIYEKAISRN